MIQTERQVRQELIAKIIFIEKQDLDLSFSGMLRRKNYLREKTTKELRETFDSKFSN